MRHLGAIWVCFSERRPQWKIKWAFIDRIKKITKNPSSIWCYFKVIYNKLNCKNTMKSKKNPTGYVNVNISSVKLIFWRNILYFLYFFHSNISFLFGRIWWNRIQYFRVLLWSQKKQCWKNFCHHILNLLKSLQQQASFMNHLHILSILLFSPCLE